MNAAYIEIQYSKKLNKAKISYAFYANFISLQKFCSESFHGYCYPGLLLHLQITYN